MRPPVALLGAALLCAAAALAAAQDAIDHPRLQERPVAPPDGNIDGAARALPATVTVCADDADRRCWRAAKEVDCAPPARVFRTVPAGDADDVLARCRATVGR